MATLKVSIQPHSKLDKPANTRSRGVVHYHEIVFENDNGEVISREASLSFDVSPEFVGEVDILDYTSGTSINVSITSSQGMLILSEDVDKPDAGATADDFVFVWKLTKPEIEEVSSSIDRVPLFPAILKREGQFISIGFTPPQFSQYTLLISPIRQTEIRSETLNKLFSTKTFGTIAKRLLVDDLPELANLPLGELISTKIGIKGQFEFSVPVDGNESGWIWLLNGPVVFIGIQDEDDLEPIATRRSILLPPPSSRDSDENVEPASNLPIAGVSLVPSSNSIDVTEEELLSNPDVFNDDPGAFCRPFSNPHRVVSERTFHTILRVEQPTVGSKPYVPPTLPGRDRFEGGDLVIEANLGFNRRDEPNIPVEGVSNEVANFIRAGLTTNTSSQPVLSHNSTLMALASNPALFQSYLTSFAKKIPRGRFTLNANHALNWEGDSSEYQATSLAFGHILETRVQWRSNGYSLGKVAHSLTLAPRQTKRIVTVQSRIVDRVRRREETDFAESVRTGTDREYTYQDQVEAHLTEWSRGSSTSASGGLAGGIGGFVNGILFGGGAAFGISGSRSSQRGGRDVAAKENQNLRDSIRAYGDSLRQLDSMVVVDQSQEEFVQGVSEIVRNINYCHSLTVIYHEILRHLRVDTRIVGARECVFVPFEIKPFTIERVLKWRDTIRNILRRRDLHWVMHYLPDKLANYVGSDIPDLRRDQIPITNITGSIFIQLKIERPKDGDGGEFLEDNWKTILAFTIHPIFGIFSFLSSLANDLKDDAFQRKYAPKIATNWANTLRIARQGNQLLTDVDFTLVNSYRYGNTMRVDFTLSDDTGTLTRADLREMTVHAEALPEGSIANVKQIRFHYYTDHFDYQVVSPRVTNDLIDAETGKPELNGAEVHIPTRRWEEINLRTVIDDATDELLAHLDEYTEWYHKMIWWNLDRDKLFMMLDGVKLSPEDERSVASVVERNPLAVIGNSLVYRVAAGAFIGVDGHLDADSLNYHYRDTNTQAEPLRISLPTSGLYAQSIMDECEACEEHFGSTEWVLNNDEPELAEIAPQLLASRRATLPEVTPSELPESIINIQNAATPPAPSGFSDILTAVTNPNAFRDMAGLAGTQANARAALESAAGLATSFGQGVVDLHKAQLSAGNAKNKMSAIDKAKQKGSISDEEAKRQTKKVLDEMNHGANNEEKFATAQQQLDMIEKLEKQGGISAQNAEIARKRVIENLTTQLSGTGNVSNEDLGNLVEQASTFGADIKKDGDSFEIKTVAAKVNTPIKEQCGFFGANNVVTETEVREEVRVSAAVERQNWLNTGGNLLSEDNDSQFGSLVGYWLSSHASIRPDTLSALQANAVSSTIDYGHLLNDGQSAATVSSEAIRVRGDLLVAVPSTSTPSNLTTLIEASIRSAYASSQDNSAWSAVFISSCVRNAAIQLGLETMSGSTHIGRNGLLLVHSGHRFYVEEAYHRRFTTGRQRSGTYHAFEITERGVTVGDIIVQDRQANTVPNVVDFTNIPGLSSRGREMHCDIIVEVDVASGFAITIGGNLGNGVRRRRYPLNADGTLIAQRNQLYTQENASGSLPAVPSPTTSTGMATLSTGRIFALLSLVEECVAVPGQPIDSGIFV